jgi:hypothetical protein
MLDVETRRRPSAEIDGGRELIRVDDALRWYGNDYEIDADLGELFVKIE